MNRHERKRVKKKFARGVWDINPVTKIKESNKNYKRSKYKKETKEILDGDW